MMEDIREFVNQIREGTTAIGQVPFTSCNYEGVEYPCRITFPDQPKGLVVYVLIDPRDGEPFFVGKTINFKLAMRTHCQVLREVHPAKQGRGVHAIDLHKIEIFDAGLSVLSLPLKVKDENQATAAKQILIDSFPKTLNTQRQRWNHTPINYLYEPTK